ncbi:hypothetical protein FRC02_000864 [Tulasnella sp. 418]|nr:hypothetical protein FRC02_000864 [Tulasnella sp. 418]
MVDEFIDSGMIEEAERVKRLRRTQALLLFSSVYSIGPTTARHLYDDIGLHSLSDLQDYANSLNTPQGEILRLALGIREDLNQKIPRNEVERIVEVVANELEAIQPGCMHTICGGYRRGKLESNDVDVVFTHPLKGTEKGLCKALVARLQAMGVVTSLLHTSSFSSNHDGPGSKRFSTSSRSGGLGGLDTALTVFRLPNSNMVKLEVMEGAEEDYGRSESIPQLVGPHRRLDIIFAPIDAYYTAVVGWTGSTQFERDLRLWANTKYVIISENMPHTEDYPDRGLRFDSSGILSLNDGRVVVAKSEHEVFRILGLDYIDPVWRNADL